LAKQWSLRKGEERRGEDRMEMWDVDKTHGTIVEEKNDFISLICVSYLHLVLIPFEAPLWYKMLPLSGVDTDTRRHFVVAFGLLHPLCLVIEAIAVLSGPCSGQLRGRGQLRACTRYLDLVKPAP
jgi:hypothetical protein